MYMIEIRITGTFRPATDDEAAGIDAHREDYPRCDGSQIRDDEDRTVPTSRPYFWCKDDEVRVRSIES